MQIGVRGRKSRADSEPTLSSGITPALPADGNSAQLPPDYLTEQMPVTILCITLHLAHTHTLSVAMAPSHMSSEPTLSEGKKNAIYFWPPFTNDLLTLKLLALEDPFGQSHQDSV